MQVLDLCVLDLDHQKYDKRELVAGSMYIQLGLTYEAFSRRDVALTPDIMTLLVAMEQHPLK
jgi:hypothetical protein